MRSYEAALDRRAAFEPLVGRGLSAYPQWGCAAATARRGRCAAPSSSRPSPFGQSSPIPNRPCRTLQPVHRSALQPAAAVPGHRPPQSFVTPDPSAQPQPEVQELLKRLVRANAESLAKELRAWRETAPEGQQRAAAGLVGAAALRVLTGVLGPGDTLGGQQRDDVQDMVRTLVAELHAIRETLTFEQLSAVASSLVLLLQLLEDHTEQQCEGRQAVPPAPTGEDGGQAAQEEQPRLACSPQQARDLAATLPNLAAATLSQHPLSAVLGPICEAYGSMLQLLQLTHTDPHGARPDIPNPDRTQAITALHTSLSDSVLCAQRITKQLRQADMADLRAAVHVAVRYRLAVPGGALAIPPLFLEAVRQRVDGLVWAAREGAAAAGAGPVAEVAMEQGTRGTGSGADPLDARSLAAVLGAMCRDLKARRAVERASGAGDKKAKRSGAAEAAWLAGTTAVLLRSHQHGKQDSWQGLHAAVQSVQAQLVGAKRDLEEANRKRRAKEAEVQQQRPAAGKKGGKAAAKQDAGAERQAEAEGGEELQLLKDEEDCRELVAIAEAEVEEAVGKLRALDVACLREQLDARVLLQLARVVAETVGQQAGAGGAGMGVALAGLLQGRVKELHPAALVQALAALHLICYSLPAKALSSVFETVIPRLDQLSHRQQLDLLTAILDSGEQTPKPMAARFMAAFTRSVSSSAAGGLRSAPSELLFAVVGTAARWRVPLDQGWLGELEQELVGRMAGQGRAPGAGALAAAAVDGSGAAVVSGGPTQGAAGHRAAGGAGREVLTRQLLGSVIIPVAKLGQTLRKPDLFVCALEEWRGRGYKPFPGLDPDKAALLLGWAASGHGWKPTPQLHKAVESLAGATVRLRCDISEDLARLVLAASKAVHATESPVSLRWKAELLTLQEDYWGIISVFRKTSSPREESEWACTLLLLNVTLGAVEPMVLCARLNGAACGTMFQEWLEVYQPMSVALATVLTSRGPPLPEGVTHWDDLALLNSPNRLDAASLLADLRRPPEARRHPLVLPTHLRTAAGGSPSPEQEAYVRSIAPTLVVLRRLLVMAAVDGAIVLQAKTLSVPWLRSRRGSTVTPPGRWAVLLGLLTHPQQVCNWLAQQEAAKATGIVSKRAREALVKEKAAALLARVPWAGHVWERQQQAPSEDEARGLQEDL